MRRLKHCGAPRRLPPDRQGCRLDGGVQMGAFGFDTAFIQRKNTSRGHYDTAWTFNVIFGVAIALLR